MLWPKSTRVYNSPSLATGHLLAVGDGVKYLSEFEPLLPAHAAYTQIFEAPLFFGWYPITSISL